jgi:hypothetical protein
MTLACTFTKRLIILLNIRYWMHQLQCCGIAVELLRVKEPQEVSQQSDKLPRKQSEKRRPRASVAVNPSFRRSSDVVVISSDDDIFEK